MYSNAYPMSLKDEKDKFLSIFLHFIRLDIFFVSDSRNANMYLGLFAARICSWLKGIVNLLF